jgi:hypothetical protein
MTVIPQRYEINSKSKDSYTYKLFLANISEEATDKDLYNLFCKYGRISKIKTWDGSLYRCGKIIFKDKVSIIKVQCEVSGLPFLNSILLVSQCKSKSQIAYEYEMDTRQGYSNEICVYGYRHYKSCCDDNIISRFIHNPEFCSELELINGPKEPGEKNFEYRYYHNVVKPHIKMRMNNAWNIVFMYRDINKEDYYNKIPSQAGKWFPDREDSSLET